MVAGMVAPCNVISPAGAESGAQTPSGQLHARLWRVACTLHVCLLSTPDCAQKLFILLTVPHTPDFADYLETLTVYQTQQTMQPSLHVC